MPSIEEKVEEHYKTLLDSHNIRHYGKTERINDAISNALQSAASKSGDRGETTIPTSSCSCRTAPAATYQ